MEQSKGRVVKTCEMQIREIIRALHSKGARGAGFEPWRKSFGKIGVRIADGPKSQNVDTIWVVRCKETCVV